MIEVRSLSKRFGDTVIFQNFDISFADNTVNCILGPSGCGKTTLLNLIAGLLVPDSGNIHRPDEISFVFQEPRLLPWESVLDNAMYAMDRRIPIRSRRETAMEMLDLLELADAHALYPKQISGGMAGRLALARALLAPSKVLLLDEPMSSLDPDLRGRTIEHLKRLLGNKTVVLVTHDYTVAAGISDRIFRFSLAPVKYSELGKAELEQALRQIDQIESQLGVSKR